MYQAVTGALITRETPPQWVVGRARKGSHAMRRIRSMATQSPAILISILAVAFSLGGGAYASTHAGSHPLPPVGQRPAAVSPANPRSAVSSVSWQSLSLKNGWASSNNTYATGNPKVSIQNGIVYLSGSLHQATPGSPVFAILPKTYRPTHNLYIDVYTNASTYGTLYIGADGVMEAYSTIGCGAGNTSTCYTSLATVSYPVNS